MSRFATNEPMKKEKLPVLGALLLGGVLGGLFGFVLSAFGLSVVEWQMGPLGRSGILSCGTVGGGVIAGGLYFHGYRHGKDDTMSEATQLGLARQSDLEQQIRNLKKQLREPQDST